MTLTNYLPNVRGEYGASEAVLLTPLEVGARQRYGCWQDLRYRVLVEPPWLSSLRIRRDAVRAFGVRQIPIVGLAPT